MKWTERESRHVVNKVIYIDSSRLQYIQNGLSMDRIADNVEFLSELENTQSHDIIKCLIENQFQITRLYNNDDEKKLKRIADTMCQQIFRHWIKLNCRFKLQDGYQWAYFPSVKYTKKRYGNIYIENLSKQIATSLFKLKPICFRGVEITESGEIILHYNYM